VINNLHLIDGFTKKWTPIESSLPFSATDNHKRPCNDYRMDLTPLVNSHTTHRPLQPEAEPPAPPRGGGGMGSGSHLATWVTRPQATKGSTPDPSPVTPLSADFIELLIEPSDIPKTR